MPWQCSLKKLCFFAPIKPNSSEFCRCSSAREGDYSRKAIISYIIHWKSCPKHFVLFPHNQKIISSKKLNMGFLSVPNLVPWSIFIVGSSASSLTSFSGSDCSSKPHPPNLPLWVSIVGYLEWWEAGTILFRVVTQQCFSLPKKETPRAQTRLVKIQVACSAGVLSSGQNARERATSRSEEEMGRTNRKSYHFYSPQSSSVIKSKMAATTTLRTRTRFHPLKIRLHCRLKYKWSICTKNDLFTKRMLILSYDPLLSDHSSIRFSETETNFRLSGNSRKNLMSF